jgi:hypothetical protein
VLASGRRTRIFTCSFFFLSIGNVIVCSEE